MAKLKRFNLVALNGEIDASCAVLAPALAKAGITTIAIDGKSVVATEAPVNHQISALLAAQPAVADSANAAEAIASNDLISKELERANTALALKTTAVETLTRENATLTASLTTANTAVQTGRGVGIEPTVDRTLAASV